MCRINPDPYAGGHLFALVHRVTGLLEGEDRVKALCQALEADGFPTDDIDVFTGEEGAHRLDLPGREHGMAVRLLRTLELAMGNEGEANQRIDEALRRGSTLLCVKVKASRKSDERARALRVLVSQQAKEIHYWGPWSISDVITS
jgi:hypothetical protein